MSIARASYVAGDWVAVSAPGRWLLVDLPPDDATVQRCWAAVLAGNEVEDVLDILIASGVRSAPSFALVSLSEVGGRAVVRGAAAVRVLAHGNLADIAAAERAVWIDEPIDTTADELTLLGGKPGVSEIELPMGSGVTLAASVRLYTHERISLEPAFSNEPRVVDEVPQARLDPIQPAAPVEADEPPVAPEESYDHLFGATQRPIPVDELGGPDVVAKQPSALVIESPIRDVGSTASWHTVAPPTDVNEPVPDSTPAAPPVIGLIDSVPDWGPPVVEPTLAPALSVADERQDEIMHTTNRAAVVAMAAQQAAEPPPLVGPTVLAGRCPVGHLTPLHSANCRVCGAPVAEQQGFEIARPTLGMLRLSTGDSVTLDRGVLIGRAPSLPDNTTERPNLVRVSSPENDVSRDHAEVVLDGWHVFIRDLGSTNGTTVELPGQAPVRLRQDDLFLLESGSVIMLADEIRCVFEVTT